MPYMIFPAELTYSISQISGNVGFKKVTSAICLNNYKLIKY